MDGARWPVKIRADSSKEDRRLRCRIITYLIYFFVIVAEIILVIGFFLLLFGTNPTAGTTQWAYRNLDRVMAPFRGIFAPIELGTTSADIDAVFDTSVLFAMIVYGILALVLSALTRWLSQRLRHLYAAEQRGLQEQADEEMRASLAALATTDTTAPPQVATSAAARGRSAATPTTPPPRPLSRRHRRPRRRRRRHHRRRQPEQLVPGAQTSGVAAVSSRRRRSSTSG